MSNYESIYNLIPREVVVPEKKPIPRSNKPSQQVVPNSTFGKLDLYPNSPIYFNNPYILGCHGSTRLLGAGHINKKDGAYFGPPKPETGLPRTITDKNRSQSPHRDDPFLYSDKRKGPVPPKDDRPIMGITTQKNYIVANAVEAILQGN